MPQQMLVHKGGQINFFFFFFWGGGGVGSGWGGGGGQGGCELRSEGFCENSKKIGGGVRVDVNGEVKLL